MSEPATGTTSARVLRVLLSAIGTLVFTAIVCAVAYMLSSRTG